MEANTVLTAQLQSTRAELASARVKLEKLTKRIAELEAAEKVLAAHTAEPAAPEKKR